jgi:hypothetical protein
MAVSAFGDLPLADRDREWDGAAAEKRVRKWAGAEDEPNAKYRDAHVWYDAENKDNFTAYKLLIGDIVSGRLVAVPRGIMVAGNVMQGSRYRRGPSPRRYRPGEKPPGEILQEDGRRRPVGARLTRAG